MPWFDKMTTRPPTPQPSTSNLKSLGQEYGFGIAKDADNNTVSIPWGYPTNKESMQFIDYWVSQNIEAAKIEQDRKFRYAGYALMDTICGEAILTLDAFADEALGVGFVEKPIEVMTKNSEAQDFIDKVWYNNKLTDKARGIVRNLAKWGDLGFIIDFPYNSSSAADMKLYQATANKWSALIPKENRMPFAYKIDDKDTYNRLPSTLNSKHRNSKLFNPWEFVHLTIPDIDFEPYGRAILEPLRTAFDQLTTIESLLAMSRASKVERLVLKVPTGNSGNPAAVLNQLQTMRAQWKNILFTDSALGKRTYAKTPALQDILLFPSSKDFDIDKIRSDVDITSIEDAEYFRDKAIMMTKLPRGYFIADQVSPRGMALQAQDVKFARALIPLQVAAAYSFVKLSTIALAYSGMKVKDVNINVRIKRPPQLSEEMLKSYVEVTDSATKILQSYKQTGEVPATVVEGKKVPVVRQSDLEGQDQVVFLNLCRMLGMPEDFIKILKGDVTNLPADSPTQYITASSKELMDREGVMMEQAYSAIGKQKSSKEALYENIDKDKYKEAE